MAREEHLQYCVYTDEARVIRAMLPLSPPQKRVGRRSTLKSSNSKSRTRHIFTLASGIIVSTKSLVQAHGGRTSFVLTFCGCTRTRSASEHPTCFLAHAVHRQLSPCTRLPYFLRRLVTTRAPCCGASRWISPSPPPCRVPLSRPSPLLTCRPSSHPLPPPPSTMAPPPGPLRLDAPRRPPLGMPP